MGEYNSSISSYKKAMKLKEKGEIKWLLYPLHRRMYM
jgi:hypothetical protein